MRVEINLRKIRELLVEYSNYLQDIKLNETEFVVKRLLNDKQQEVDKHIISLATYMDMK
jgi:hypothetical protein